jgi:glutathione S-transferase
MILIGQYDSPFVRRVAVTLRRYELAFEHRPLSVWKDAEAIAPFNPLRRVPVLVLDDGMCLVDSSVILEVLDDMVPPERALLPRSGPLRRDGLRVAALAVGLADKAVTLMYERVLRKEDRRSAVWVSRCQLQIRDTLTVLEADRARRKSAYWLGETPSHADLAVACTLRFLGEAHPTLFRVAASPALASHAARCEALPEMKAIYQPLIVQPD